MDKLDAQLRALDRAIKTDTNLARMCDHLRAAQISIDTATEYLKISSVLPTGEYASLVREIGRISGQIDYIFQYYKNA